MKKIFYTALLALLLPATLSVAKKTTVQKDLFPDGTEVPAWFHDVTPVDVSTLGTKYKLYRH